MVVLAHGLWRFKIDAGKAPFPVSAQLNLPPVLSEKHPRNQLN